MKIDWASLFSIVSVMTVVGFIVFDNIILTLSFIGISGVCSGLIFATEKKNSCN